MKMSVNLPYCACQYLRIYEHALKATLKSYPFTDGGKVVSYTHRPRSIPKKNFYAPDTDFG
jgi:hypothetical protein